MHSTARAVERVKAIEEKGFVFEYEEIELIFRSKDV